MEEREDFDKQNGLDDVGASVPAPVSNIKVIQPEEKKVESPNPLSIQIYDGKTLSNLLEDSIRESEKAQEYTKVMIEHLKEMVLQPRDEGRTEFDVMMCIGPIIKDFITEYTSQIDGKVKIATTVSNILKAQQANSGQQILVNNTNVTEAPAPKESMQDKLKDIDPLAKSFERPVTVITPKKKKEENQTEEGEISEDTGTEVDIESVVIHSPDFNSKKTII